MEYKSNIYKSPHNTELPASTSPLKEGMSDSTRKSPGKIYGGSSPQRNEGTVVLDPKHLLNQCGKQIVMSCLVMIAYMNRLIRYP